MVTGGAAGIGRGITEALLEEGARVVIADVEEAVLEIAVKELADAGPVRGVVTDVSSAESVEALATDVFAREGACHLLFNNAGVTSGGGGRPWEQEANDWAWCFSVNVFGVANGVLSFVPRMIESGEPGVVVNTSSMDGGIAPVPYASVYASSKAAISCFTEALAHQLVAAGTDLRAAVFYPSGGLLDTGLWTAQRNRPDALRTGQAQATGPRHHLRGVQGAAGGGRPPGRGDGPPGARPLLRAGSEAGRLHHRDGPRGIGGLVAPARRCDRSGTPAAGRTELMTATSSAPARYTVVSADGHAGGDIGDYRPYLARRWHDEFDAWAAEYVNPYADLIAPIAYRSWDSDRRLAETESDGIAAEVLFPNTVPPFFAEGNLVALPPTPEDYERRWAGVQAHNRWLADFCARAPGRRAGIVQVFANDMSDAVAEVRWAAETFQPFGGILLPSIPPNSHLPPLWEDHYEPLWRVCAELDVPINIHGGTALPDYGEHEAARAMMLIEIPWFSHRSVWHLIFSGVLERYPTLRFSVTEQGVAWLPRGLQTLDWFYGRMTTANAAEANFFGAAAAKMTMTPTEYFARNFWIGASFLRPSEAPLCRDLGIDRVMWGADYPHSEGSYPYTTEALRVAFAAYAEPDVRAMVESTAASFYGFDLGVLRPIGDRVGPLVAEVAQPLASEDWPTKTTCNAFDPTQILRAW